ITRKLDHPVVSKHTGKLHDSRRNSFEYLSRSPSSESPSHGPTLPEGGKYYRWWKAPPFLYLQEKRLPTYPVASHISVLEE
ncbi:hypothetical protein AVEN_189225-1, partial [Araneus ventricosus]